MLGDRPYTFDRVVRLALGAGLAWGLVSLLGYLSEALVPFAVALILAYMVNPLVSLVQKKIKNRAAAVTLTLAGALALLFLAAGLTIPMIVGEIRHMARIVSDVAQNADLARKAAERLPPDLWQAIKDFLAREDIQAFFHSDSFIGLAQSALKRVLPGAWGVIAGTAEVLMGLFGLLLIAMYLVFLLVDYQSVKKTWSEIIPPAYRPGLTAFLSDFESGMSRYFRAQALLAGIVAIVFAVGFSLIGLPLAILLGLFLGLLNMIPYLQLLGVPPAILLGIMHAVETGTGIWTMLGLIALVFAVAQIVQDWILAPRIMGQAMGLSPAIMILSLSVWGKLLGFLGLLIALPLTCLCWAWYRRLVADIPAVENGGEHREGGTEADPKAAVAPDRNGSDASA